MKRILIVHEKYGLSGGAEQFIYTFAQQLGADFDFSILFDEDSGNGAALFDPLFSRDRALDFSATESDLREPVQQLLDEVRPQLVFVHKCLSFPLLKLLKASGIPMARMVHDHDTYCLRSYRYFPWSRKVCDCRAGWKCVFPCLAMVKRSRQRRLGYEYKSLRRLLQGLRLDRQFDAVIANSEYMKAQLLLNGFAESKTHVIYPLPPDRAVEPLPMGEAAQEILYVGQVIRGKGLDYLIRSLSRMRQEVRLTVCGTGSFLPACKALAQELGLSDRISFEGFVAPERLPDYYARSLCVAVPSVWPEPFGMVGLEAMRYGRSVVGFDVGGIGEWLQDGVSGYLVPWGDVDAMASALDQLAENRSLAEELGQQAARFAAEYFSCSREMDKLRALLLDCCKP